MNDELVLFGVGLDQPIPDDNAFWEERIDEILEKAFKEQDVEYALNACESLVRVAKLSGRALATMLYKLKAHWNIFEVIENFEELAYPRIGLHPHTIERYIKVAEMFATHAIPAELEEQIKQRNMGELIPIANAVAQGYEFDAEDWKELANSPDFSTISKKVRDIKGQPPRKSRLIIMVDVSGSLWAMNDEDRKFVGSLEIADDEPIVKKAINRILDSAGVMRQ